jgi:predicted house-cleaning NTP pyrophosphatase (Maf/HAM1 superfamily)
MREYSDEEIYTYTASGDPLDKAGAYAIQHSGFNPVHNLQGCYANVMGLPLCHLTRVLMRLGLDPGLDVPTACQQSLRYACSVFEDILFPGR